MIAYQWEKGKQIASTNHSSCSVLLWYQSNSQNSTGTIDYDWQERNRRWFPATCISPYDITSLDNPGLSITPVQLRGENYDEWARSLRTALRARKKFGLDRTIKRPNEKSEDLEDWWTINSLLVSWIQNTIEPSLRSTISLMEVAKDLWNDIKKCFSITNGPQI